METKPHNRRIFAGMYLEHATGKRIIVITVAKNIETDEDMVMCKNAKLYGKPEYFIVSKRFFCEMVIDDVGEWVDRYARQTCEYFSDEYGSEGLKKAIKATRLHIDYRKDCGHPVDYIEAICNKYQNRL